MHVPVIENDIDSDVITVGDSQLASGGRQSPSKIKCLYTNAQSLVKKHLELKALVDIYDPDIIGITETWLNKYSFHKKLGLRLVTNYTCS